MILKHKTFVSEIELNDSKTAALIQKALPIKAGAQVWKEEIYFEIPVSTGQEKGIERVSNGDVTYWPPGKCFCVFFGNTQPVSAVTIIGKVKTGLDKFQNVRDGDELELTA